MDELMLDGNAVGGLLLEVFAQDVTRAGSRCDACGASEQLGALRVHANAPGVVVRCPHCDAVLLRLAFDRDRIWVDLRGLRYLELRRAD
jgi:Family of unknown function (DUF6510)